MKEMTIEELVDYVHDSVNAGILTVSCDPIVGEMFPNNPLNKYNEKIKPDDLKKVGLKLKSLSKEYDDKYDPDKYPHFKM